MFGMSVCLGFSRFVLVLSDGQITYREIFPSHVSPIRKVTVIVGASGVAAIAAAPSVVNTLSSSLVYG